MSRQGKRLAWVAALVALIVLVTGARPVVVSAAAPDFSLTTNYSWSGFLLRGETWDPHPPCVDCLSFGGPHYAFNDGYGGCYIDSNGLAITPSNGFDAPVTLSVSGLPAGITSRMPTPVLIQAPGYPYEGTFELEASPSAALGTYTVTVTATSGSLVHTITRTVTVVDQAPPPCNSSPSPWPALGYDNLFGNMTGGEVRTEHIIMGSPAPAGGSVVTFTSSDPSVLSAPAPVTIPAGLQGATIQIVTHPVSGNAIVTLTTAANGNTITTSIGVYPPPPNYPETVTITQAQYDSSTQELLLMASDPNYGGVALLTVLNASTNDVIGTMNRLGGGGFGAVLPSATNPGTIRVVSSITGASATATIL